jgi:hypothetical protein
MPELIDNELVGDAVDAYLAWRDACDAVWAATASDYLTALDREECAANVYADAIARSAAASDCGREAPNAVRAVGFWRWQR